MSRKGERRRGRWRRRQQHTKTRERGEEGRDRREEGRCTAQKLEGGSVPSDIMTGGAQGSDERGDRTAGERQNGGQMGQKGGARSEGRDEEKDRTRPRHDGQEGKMCCGEEGSERTPPSCLTTLYVQSGQLFVCGGRRVVVYVMANRRLHSKRKKRKALATHHVIRIMNSPIK